MSTIIFKCLDTASHYNATYKLAQELMNRNHRVIYLGHQSFKETIIRQGFEFYNHANFTTHEKAPEGNWIKKLIFRYKINQQYKNYFLNGSPLEAAISKFKPDLMILDVSLSALFPILLEKKIKFMVFTTKVSLNKAPLVPPFTSSFIPKNNIWSRIQVALLWQGRLLKNQYAKLIDRIKFFGASNFELTKKYLQRNNYAPKEIINQNRVTHFGIKIAPEIILSLQEFDFPREIENNQLYMCPCVNLSRNELPMDHHISEILLKSEKNSFEKIVYCSFGSYDSKYKMTRIMFLIKLLNVFLKKRNYLLLASTGRDINPAWFNFNAPNIYLYQNLSQLEILSKCDLMINQGGMQSIQECILKEVPMLVYPLNPELDQEGNAARVVYHGLGVRGNMIKDTEAEIDSKIEKVLQESTFKSNIKNLKARCLENDSFERGLNFIEAYITNPNSGIHTPKRNTWMHKR
ncbi:glycosyltransferase [Chitinophagaceae bacterium LB-8]|uniref:Glycosyltransferase n=1 Tax=Paraflavisolibacter caeni TaxID=2982496 RepID=A0A9X3BFZ4_9BACT|nr:glycosyltransferase [Paraflavisolibacter caeni]MCU7549954.1 glycosyltransferase [Paraflavisolibacter caeni]